MELATLGLFFALGTWAYQDAEIRGVPGWRIAIMMICFLPISPLVWVIARPAKLPPPDEPAPFDLEQFREQ